MTMADRIVVMQAGIIEQVGSPMELYRSPRNLFVAGFIGSPRMNFLPATVTSSTADATSLLIAGTLPLNLPALALRPGTSNTLGVRPEHLLLTTSGGLPAVVQTVEHLGSESYLHLSLQTGETLTARVSGETILQPEDHVHLALDPATVHLFDEHGTAIVPSTAQPQ